MKEYSSTLYVLMARKKNCHPYISIASDELKSHRHKSEVHIPFDIITT